MRLALPPLKRPPLKRPPLKRPPLARPPLPRLRGLPSPALTRPPSGPSAIPAPLVSAPPLRAAWPALRRDRVALIACCLALLAVLVALLAPVIASLFGAPGAAHRDPASISAFGTPTGPSSHHLLGVDDDGHDVLAATLVALRPALLVGILAPAAALLLAAALGALAGTLGGAVDLTVRGLANALRTVPPLLLALALAVACVHDGVGSRPGLVIVAFAVLVALWPRMTLKLRDQARALAGHDHVAAARAAGAPLSMLLRTEVLPCLVAPAAALLVAAIPEAILAESALSFLGVGAHISWGAEIAGVEHTYDTAWWALIFPGIALLGTVLVFAAGGRGVSRALSVTAESSRSRGDDRGAIAAPPARRPVRAVLLTGAAELIGLILVSCAIFGLGSGGLRGFGHRLGDVLDLSLGRSRIYAEPVRTLLGDHLGPTVSLVAGGFVVGAGVMLALALTAAGRAQQRRTRVVRALALVAGSAAPFWTALLALYLFGDDVGRIGILPGAGRYAPLTHPGSWLGALLMPWFTVAAAFAFTGARTLLAGIAAGADTAAALTARAAGLAARTVLARRGLRRGLRALAADPRTGAGVVAGAVILVEVAFEIPGLGALTRQAVMELDLPALQGVVLLFGFVIIAARVLAGLLPESRP